MEQRAHFQRARALTSRRRPRHVKTQHVPDEILKGTGGITLKAGRRQSQPLPIVRQRPGQAIVGIQVRPVALLIVECCQPVFQHPPPRRFPRRGPDRLMALQHVSYEPLARRPSRLVGVRNGLGFVKRGPGHVHGSKTRHAASHFLEVPGRDGCPAFLVRSLGYQSDTLPRRMQQQVEQ